MNPGGIIVTGNPDPRSDDPNRFLPREVVAERLAMPSRVLLRYEARGLVHPVRRGDAVGYGPAEIRQLWTVVTLHRELGVNLAGIEAILKLRRHVDELHARVATLADELREALEAVDRDPDSHGT